VAYKLVIFDFDGTLADSAPWFRTVLNQIAARYGFRTVSAEELEALRGKDNRAIIAHLGVPFWKLPLIASYMRGLVAQSAGSIPLFAGVDALLGQLQASGVAVAVVSSNSEQNVRRILGPENAARVRYYACGAGLFGKPGLFRKVLKLARVRPEEALSVGDEVRDIEAARAVGVRAAAVTWGYHTAELLRARGPDVVFETLEAVAAGVTGRG
jgi:phosphoglycolate phosphatase